MIEKTNQYFNIGISSSLLGHVLLFLLLVVQLGDDSQDWGKPIIYSISLEGGKNLGGISQIPTRQDKQPPAPPKNVSAPPPKEEKKEEEVKEEAKPEEKASEPVEDAEVSLKEPKKETPPTPAPKVENTPKKAEPTKAVKPPKKEPSKAPSPKPKQPSTKEIDKQLQQAMQRYLGESTEANGKGFGAGSLGGKGFGGGRQKPPEFFTYRAILKDHVKRGWKWFDTASSLTAEVSFEISPEGTLYRIEIVRSSGNREFDESVLRAVSKASPVPAPPQSVYESDFKWVRMTFDPKD